MCLAIPGQVEELFLQDSLPMARVAFGGIKKGICMSYVPEARVGNFVLVHVGFAIATIDEDEAARLAASLNLDEELSVGDEP